MASYIMAGNVAYPFVYQGSILAHPKEEEELRNIIERSGAKGQVVAKMRACLDFLAANGRNAIIHPTWFEKLLNEDDMFSMHVVCGKLNIRILYAFFGTRPVLLHAFLEKKKATAKTESYGAARKIARNRAKEISSGWEWTK